MARSLSAARVVAAYSVGETYPGKPVSSRVFHRSNYLETGPWGPPLPHESPETSTGSAGPRPRPWSTEWSPSALEGNAFAARLAERMRDETSTRFVDWVDHLVVADPPGLARRLHALGYARQAEPYAVGAPVYAHPGGVFPRIAVADRATAPRCREVAIKVESVAAFSRAHDLGLEIVGYPLGPYRVGRVAGERTSLAVVERRGYLGFEPFPGELAREGRMQPHAARDALAARELWQGRRRRFDDDAEGFDATEATARTASSSWPARPTWPATSSSRSSATTGSRGTGPRRSRRRGRTGSAWAGRTTTTTRSAARAGSSRASSACSRRSASRSASGSTPGEHAGWGAQILEHPTTGIVIFADLDLAPDEADARLRPPAPCPTCPGPTRSGSGSACTASRSSRPACTTSKPSSTSTPSATA